MILFLDFSKVSGETVEEMQRSFEEKCKIAIEVFREAYKDIIPDELREEMSKQTTFQDELNILTSSLPLMSDKKIYILVDEYDNFSNRILAQAGSESYRSLTHGTGFFKSFFALLKAENKVIQRILLTGVSPMTLDDVTSVFNIANNISQNSKLATLCGFTHKDIRQALDYYAEAGLFPMDREQAFQLVTDWYDHYRFSEDNSKQVCHPLSLLNFLKQCMDENHFPCEMVDENLRTDYRKLRHAITTYRKPNKRFNIIEQLIADGSITTRLIRSFDEDTLNNPESFISLLFYYGMVTMEEVDYRGVKLAIPNQLMRQLLSDLLLCGYKDAFA